MSFCTNHPDTDAYGICKYCGKPFCKECLVEGKEFNSCRNPDCLKANEFGILPHKITCPKCGKKITLSEKERNEVIVHCHKCESTIDFSVDPPAITEPKKYAEVTWSMNQGDLFIIKSILDDAEIDYYTMGENFLSVDPLIQPARFFVVEDQIDTVKELLKETQIKISGISLTDIPDDDE